METTKGKTVVYYGSVNRLFTPTVFYTRLRGARIPLSWALRGANRGTTYDNFRRSNCFQPLPSPSVHEAHFPYAIFAGRSPCSGERMGGEPLFEMTAVVTV